MTGLALLLGGCGETHMSTPVEGSARPDVQVEASPRLTIYTGDYSTFKDAHGTHKKLHYMGMPNEMKFSVMYVVDIGVSTTHAGNAYYPISRKKFKQDDCTFGVVEVNDDYLTVDVEGCK